MCFGNLNSTVNPKDVVQNIILAPAGYEQRPLCHSRQQPGEGWRNSRGCDLLKILMFFLAKKITVEQLSNITI
jgi:hypothetical protein